MPRKQPPGISPELVTANPSVSNEHIVLIAAAIAMFRYKRGSPLCCRIQLSLILATGRGA